MLLINYFVTFCNGDVKHFFLNLFVCFVLFFQYEGNYYICAATPNSILLLRYNSGIGTFCTRKVIRRCLLLNCLQIKKYVYGSLALGSISAL